MTEGQTPAKQKTAPMPANKCLFATVMTALLLFSACGYEEEYEETI